MSHEAPETGAQMLLRAIDHLQARIDAAGDPIAENWEGWMTGGLGGSIGDLGADMVRCAPALLSWLREQAAWGEMNPGLVSHSASVVASTILGEVP